MRYLTGTLFGLVLCVLWLPAGARAAATPPPPTSTPACGYCSGPPPPPTPVPTAPAAPLLPVSGASRPALPTARKADINQVSLSPQSVRRGHSFKVSVHAQQPQSVVIAVQFPHHGPTLYRGKLAHSGSYTRSILVPAWAPLGKASVKITLSGPSGTSSRTAPVALSFTVVK